MNPTSPFVHNTENSYNNHIFALKDNKIVAKEKGICTWLDANILNPSDYKLNKIAKFVFDSEGITRDDRTMHAALNKKIESYNIKKSPKNPLERFTMEFASINSPLNKPALDSHLVSGQVNLALEYEKQSKEVKQFSANCMNGIDDSNIQFFNDLLSEIKYVTVNQFLTPGFNIKVDSLLEGAKGSRLQLRMIAYALFSGERRSTMPSASMKCLLFMLSDPTALNENIVKLIKKALVSKQEDWRDYPPSAKTEQPEKVVKEMQPEVVKEKGYISDNSTSIPVSHGGGLFFLLEFLKGEQVSGYKADIEYEGHGIFVFAQQKKDGTNKNRNDDTFYGRRGELHFDIPTKLTMDIPGNLLGTTNVKNEGVLRQTHLDHAENISMEGVPIGFNEMVNASTASAAAGADKELEQAINRSIMNSESNKFLKTW
ncbi:MAG: hypothetical protein H0X29_06215 [Parachlamydiaceae bacterium]|nr:hypothetical protein [Parachlamydiaceae bacterium]